jgi:hypothetical protein|tara:strand:+ start:5256 stop:5858 length:603 start_codon:yes stop_codon:yes gene_type:complete
MTTENVTQESWEEAVGRVSEGEQTAPAAMQEGEMLSTAADEFATRVSSLRHKGYVPYWDTKTGVYNECPQYMRWQIGEIKHPDGSPMYTFVDPKIPPDHGLDLFCPLNPNSPTYEKVQNLGFVACRKKHIPNHNALDMHVQKSHKRAAAALEQLKTDAIREEDRDLQRQMLQSNQQLIQSLAGQVAPQAVTQEDKDEKPF